ncbi:hypothetical protein G3M48_009999 [Beauveria asiatica]|uniref:FAD-binding PCMH-type domain-containing protein n=1 Tax=Beauveria asiatica TaxID=1069075 RepID=A0AAW0RII6_9HYPO
MRYAAAYIAIFLFQGSIAAAEDCKCSPSDPCWPSSQEWQALNETVSGRLTRATPPGSVCYPSEPNYNQSACQVVIDTWSDSAFHSSDPISVTSPWANNECYPIHPNGTSIAGDAYAGERGCSIGYLPPYVINATDAGHVQAALSFAKKWKIRVAVKNTGHNGAGRNLGYGSLSIWTHNMKSIHVHNAFRPRQNGTLDAEKPQMAATIGAGVRDGELFAAMTRRKLLAVGGTNQDVGVVGWATGGGHGFMTGKFGQGADNILEAEIVTPGGDLITANVYQNKDIFWAIRGGGGGTFGVIVSLTIKAYPMPTLELWSMNVAAKHHTESKGWWRLIARLHSLIPELQDQDIHGYYTITGPPASNTLSLGGALLLWGGANGTFENAVRPLRKLLTEANDTSTYTLAPTPITSFDELLAMYPAGESGVTTEITASRLLSRQTMKDKELLLAQTLEQVGPRAVAPSDGSPNFSVSGTMTISKTAVDNALNPAWRDTAVHLITSRSWGQSLPRRQALQIVNDMTYSKLNALKELDPGSGAYLNELGAGLAEVLLGTKLWATTRY